MRHARGQKLQSFRRKWPFYKHLYSLLFRCIEFLVRILFDIFNIFHVFYKMYCSFAHNIISASTMASFQFEHIKNEYFIAWPFTVYKYIKRLIIDK